jgi:Domain of unknown function (DUF4417)
MDELRLWGCFIKCSNCDPATCDWTCPKNTVQFVNRFREVGGWPPKPLQNILTPKNLHLPIYLPQIHNGHCRNEELAETIVAVPTFSILKRRENGGYGPIKSNGSALRKTLKLSEGTKILLISVAEDHHLERFWHYAEDCDVGAALRDLNIEAITAPNFSLFSDVPRPHSIWNLARICRATEYLSSSGINVIPHINAMTKLDWDYTKQMLENHQHISHVVKEFQTGGRNKEKAMASIHGLADLRDSIGRDFHVIAVGGNQYAPVFRKYFSKITFVDSAPFIKTHKRRKLVESGKSRPRWMKYGTEAGEPLDNLLRENIELYRTWQKRRFETVPLDEEVNSLKDIIPLTNEIIPKEQDEFSFV